MTKTKIKTVTIIQPLFIPWLGYFDMMARSDVFVILDTVQFSKQSWQQRNRIKTPKGLMWLTIPIKHNFGDQLLNIKIDYRDVWMKKHLGAFHAHYKKAPHFKEIYVFMEKFYHQKPELISDFTSSLIKGIAKYLGIKTRIIHSKDLPVKRIDAQSYLIDICQHLGANNYLNGPTGKKLYSPEVFRKHGINLTFYEYHHPVYPQLHGDFISHVSIVDLLFNCGPKSRNIISQTPSSPRCATP